MRSVVSQATEPRQLDNLRAVEELPEINVIGTTPLSSPGLPLEQVPGNVQTATSPDLYRHESLDLTDFMRRTLTSVYANEVLANPFQPDITYRGFIASPILGTPIGLSVYQDSVRINEPFGDTINWDLIPRAAIASIELVPGSNPLFGLNTLGGSLSIQTKSGFSYPGTRAQAYGGSFGRRAIEVEHGGSCEGFGWFFAGNMFEEDGWRDFSESEVRQAFVRVGWENAATNIEVSYTFADNELTGNGVAPQSLLAADRSAVYAHPEITSPELHFVNVTLGHLLAKDWKLLGNGYFRRNTTDVFAADVEVEQEEPDEFDIEPVINRTATGQESHGGSFQTSYGGTLFGRENRASFGATFDVGDTDFIQSRQDGMLTESRGVDPDEDEVVRTRLNATNDYYGVYFTDTLSFMPWLHLTGSVRWNYAEIKLRGIGTDEDGDVVSLDGEHDFERINPAAGFTLQPLTMLMLDSPLADLSVFFNYNEGFRVPTPMELTCADPDAPCSLPTNFVADPPLDPIVARTWEAGLRGRWHAALDWSLAFFRTDLSDDILFINSAGTFTSGFFQNVGDTRREGIEFGLRGHTERLTWYANYSYVDATYETNITLQNAVGPIAVRPGDRIPSIPKHLAKFGAEYEPLSGWFLGADLLYVSRQFLRGDDNNQFPQVPGYAVVNLNTHYRLTSYLEVFAMANNVFDEEYEAFGLINRNAFSDPVGNVEPFLSPGAPIAGWVGVRVRFD